MAAQAVSTTPTPLRAAIEARDLDALVAALASDVVLRSPIFDVPFEGIDEASDLFTVLLEVLWPLTYVDEIPGDPHVLHFTGEIKGTRLEGIDLLRFDDQGRVREITVFFRPFPGAAAFLSAMGPKLGRRRGGAGRAATLAAAGAPVSALMRATASLGPRLLGLSRGE
ncbi:MAG: nuclear transport factor 2 family protein [Solirubrobacterales bacterium]